MSDKLLKILGLLFVFGGAACSVGGSFISNEQRERKIEELVDKKLAERENEEES